MATHALSRRGFLGHVAGAYAATTIVAGTAHAATLSELIEHHKRTNKAWGDACMACDGNPTRENMDREGEAAQIDEDAKLALLSYRPHTVEEAGDRFAYLFSRSGPWATFAIDPDDVRIVADSMMAEA